MFAGLGHKLKHADRAMRIWLLNVNVLRFNHRQIKTDEWRYVTSLEYSNQCRRSRLSALKDETSIARAGQLPTVIANAAHIKINGLLDLVFIRGGELIIISRHPPGNSPSLFGHKCCPFCLSHLLIEPG